MLAPDGVDDRDVQTARERGRFADVHEPARLVSTFPSISDIAWRVRQQFGGFDDLREPPLTDGAMHVVPSDDRRGDRFVRRTWRAWQDIPEATALVLLAVPARAMAGRQALPWVRFDVRLQDRSTPEGRLVRSVALPVAAAWRHDTRPLLAWRAADAGLTHLDPNGDYTVRVQLEYRRNGPGGAITERVQTLASMALRIAPGGTPWSY